MTTKKDWRSSSLGERIEHICELRGWSLNKLGDESGISSGPMSKLARRTEQIAATPETLLRIADAAGVNPMWLMAGRGPVENAPHRRGKLSANADWPGALEDAKKRQRGIPDEFWTMAGDSVLDVDHVDWQLIVGVVRELYSAHQRAVENDPAPRSARR